MRAPERNRTGLPLLGGSAGRRRLSAFLTLIWTVLFACEPGLAFEDHQPDRANKQHSFLGPDELGVIVNERDALSVAIGDYYVSRRKIPAHNIVRISVDPARATIGSREFAALKAAIDKQTPPTVEAFALTWMKPYRVECMSITSAVAMGFDAHNCADGCVGTPFSRYFNSSSHSPYTDFRIRPAMSIAAWNFEYAKTLIDRGVAADGSAPDKTAYLVTTDDPTRNVRARSYRDAVTLAERGIAAEILDADTMHDRNDVMFYFTGEVSVAHLATLHFLPGAIADHLTSAGGILDGTSQMSILRWLEAGATASYGTVVEPCNITAKFPNPGIMMHRYLNGETAIEAYWKSVGMPSQGIFVGEPLSAPYRQVMSQ